MKFLYFLWFSDYFLPDLFYSLTEHEIASHCVHTCKVWELHTKLGETCVWETFGHARFLRAFKLFFCFSLVIKGTKLLLVTIGMEVCYSSSTYSSVFICRSLVVRADRGSSGAVGRVLAVGAQLGLRSYWHLSAQPFALVATSITSAPRQPLPCWIVEYKDELSR